MNYDNEISAPIAELQASQIEEINKYKWFESQRLGRDIGWRNAADEWFAKHFADWLRDQRRLVDEALSMAEPQPTAPRVRKVRALQSA